MAKKMTHEEFISDLAMINPTIEVLGQYNRSKEKIECRCRVCGNRWFPVAGNIRNGQGCPICSRKRAARKITKTQHQFIEDVKKRNPTVEILGEYKNVNSGILCKCKICEYEWSPKANSLMNGVACPQCCHTGTSFVEQFILQAFRIALGDNAVKSRDRKAIGKELDIYIPSLNLAVEPGSWFWHKNKIKKDREKILRCREKGIYLLVIYDCCKEQCTLIDEDFIIFDEDLSQEANHKKIIDIIERVLSSNGKAYYFTDDEIKIISNYAIFHSRRKTTNEFIEELRKISPTIEVLGDYRGNKTPVKCRCLECGYIWSARPNGLLRGTGCKKCSYDKNGKKRTLTHQEFIDKLYTINKDVIVLDQYEKANKRIKCQCKICGRVWYPFPYVLLQGRGCSDCRKKQTGRNEAKTHEQFIYELQKVNPNITVTGEYYSRKEPIECKCKKCGYVWKPLPDNLLHGHGCQRCAGKERYTLESFKERLSAVNPNVEVLGKYVNNRSNILCSCSICGYRWSPTLGSLLSGQGCPLCAGKLKYDKETFRLKMKIVNPSIEIIGEYLGRSNRVECRCKICGYAWNPFAKSLLIGRGCPRKKKHINVK